MLKNILHTISEVVLILIYIDLLLFVFPFLPGKFPLFLILPLLLVYLGLTRGSGKIKNFINSKFKNSFSIGDSDDQEPILDMSQALAKAGVNYEYLTEAIRQSNFLRSDEMALGVLNVMESFCMTLEDPDVSGNLDFTREFAMFRDFDLLMKLCRNTTGQSPAEQLEHYKFWSTISETRNPDLWELTRKHMSATLENLNMVARVNDRINHFSARWDELNINIERMKSIRAKYDNPEFSHYLADYQKKLDIHTKSLERVSKICSICSVFRAMMVIKTRILSLRRFFEIKLGKRISEVERAILYSDRDTLTKFSVQLNDILRQYHDLLPCLNLAAFLDSDKNLKKFMDQDSEKVFQKYLTEMVRIASTDLELFQAYQKKLDFVRDILELDSMQVPVVDQTVSDIKSLMEDYIELNSEMEKSLEIQSETDSILYVLSEPEKITDLSNSISSELAAMNLQDLAENLSSRLEAVSEIDDLYSMELSTDMIDSESETIRETQCEASNSSQ
ncbi:MAG: hypothetical protein CVV64_14725 [Candidatus Wallbacteria bacterium HGW-Wallbacteria-1]|jgi:hypothetical protein|uniref:Uncharacterized protein n=1 Tax=Candidatus Wallbacteria bacterium HGW-Wallbacteria-1 TaxID=2013854 RepID=A0A2N1PM43_9BACT|nr:MAG: hypothetical protein CVV64_14725 [Candidatus Wallbacteria bacterium HGW-Wallbacteria-1]